MNKKNKKVEKMTPVNTTDFKSATLKVGTAFSGIGAFEESLKQLGIKHENKFMIEIDKFARQTYLANHDVDNVYDDITKLDPAELDDIDIFVFGSPCQSFSMQGNRRGLEDTRGTLVFYGLNIIKEKQPKYFIYENVKGMLNHDGGRTFAIIKEAFDELNYDIKYEVLNAKHYGAAQNRERLFIVGIRKDIDQDFTFPKPSKVNFCVNDFIVNCKYKDYTFDTTTIEVAIEKKKTDIKKVFILPHIKYGSDKKIYSTKGISPCLLSGNVRPKFYDEKNKIFRYMTETEMQHIQGFGLNFIFPVSNRQVRKQIGNSIYVGVLNEISKMLLPQQYFKADMAQTDTQELVAA